MAADWKDGASKTYKTPIIKTDEDKAFYEWLNTYSNKNKLITRALKMLWKLETDRGNDGGHMPIRNDAVQVQEQTTVLEKSASSIEGEKTTITRVRFPSGSTLRNLSKLSDT